MRVALVYGRSAIDTRGPNSRHARVVGLSVALTQEGNSVTVVTMKQQQQALVDLYAALGASPPKIVAFTTPSALDFAMEVHDFLRTAEIDIAHVWSGGAPSLIESQISGTPIVLDMEATLLEDAMSGSVPGSCGRGHSYSRHLLEVQALRQADCVITHNNQSQQLAKAFGQPNTAMVPVGVPVRLVNEAQTTAGDRVLFVLGDMTNARSGALVAAKMIENALGDGHTKVTAWASRKDPALWRSILEQFDDADDQFRFVDAGARTQHEIVRMFDEHRAVVFPGLMMMTGYLAKLAIARGRPVIAFAREALVGHSYTALGLPNDPRSAANLRSALAHMQDNASGPIDVPQFATWDDLLHRHLSVYERTIAGALSRGRSRGW